VKLYVLRHGQCWANARGLAAGAGDNSFLTVQGVSESEAAARELAHLHFDAILTSPLRRAVQTAEILRDEIAPNLAIESNPDFKELDIGECTDGPDANYVPIMMAGKVPSGGEPLAHFLRRVEHGLESLKKRHLGTVLLVCHQGTARMIDCSIQHWPATSFGHHPGLANGELKEIQL